MTQSEKKRFTLRLPQDLLESIDKKSKKKGLSRNAYILWILDEYDKKHGNT